MYIKIRIIDTEFIHDLFDLYFLDKNMDFIFYLSSIIVNHIISLFDGENLSDLRKKIIYEFQNHPRLFQICNIYENDIYDIYDIYKNRLHLDFTGYYVIEILYYGLYQEEINLEYPLKKIEINISQEDYVNHYYCFQSYCNQLYFFLLGLGC
jgi:hypothetical protein